MNTGLGLLAFCHPRQRCLRFTILSLLTVCFLPYAYADDSISVAEAKEELHAFFESQIKAELFSPDPESSIRIAFNRSPAEMRKKALLLSSMYTKALDHIDAKQLTSKFMAKAKKDALELLVAERAVLLKDQKRVNQRVTEYLRMAAGPLAMQPLPDGQTRSLQQQYSAYMDCVRSEMLTLFSARAYRVSEMGMAEIGDIVNQLIAPLRNIGPVCEQTQRNLERKYLQLILQDAVKARAVHACRMADWGFTNIFMAQAMAREMLNAKRKTRDQVVAYLRLLMQDDDGNIMLSSSPIMSILTWYAKAHRFVMANEAMTKKLLDAAHKRREELSEKTLPQGDRLRLLRPLLPTGNP